MGFKIEEIDRNIVSVNGHQFPVDADLKLNKNKQEWFTKAFRERYGFENKPQLFQSYMRTGNVSRLFARNSILQVMTERKTKGTKIIPGYGVFLAPTYVRFVINRNGELVGRAFSKFVGLSKEFAGSIDSIVAQMTNYYNQKYDEYFDRVEKGCFFPTTRSGVSDHRVFETHLLPTGVYAHWVPAGKRIQVKYSVAETVYHFANTDLADLGHILYLANEKRNQALDMLRKERYTPIEHMTIQQFIAQM